MSRSDLVTASTDSLGSFFLLCLVEVGLRYYNQLSGVIAAKWGLRSALSITWALNLSTLLLDFSEPTRPKVILVFFFSFFFFFFL